MIAVGCSGSGAQVNPVNEAGDLVCPVCQKVCDTGWWDSALHGVSEAVPDHPAEAPLTP